MDDDKEQEQSSKKRKLNKKKRKNRKKKNQKPFNFGLYKQRHVAFKFAYFGHNYHGFVIQENIENTIEHHLFSALKRTCLIESVESSDYSRCGRTDKGVSCSMNVMALKVRSVGIAGDDDEGLPSKEEEMDYIQILNGVLPSEIRMLSWCPVDPAFSARFDCKQRAYKYLFYRDSMDIEAMQRACSLMVGTHDFRNFCKMTSVEDSQ